MKATRPQRGRRKGMWRDLSEARNNKRRQNKIKNNQKRGVMNFGIEFIKESKPTTQKLKMAFINIFCPDK